MALIGSLPNPRNVETCCPSLRPLPTSLVPIIPGGPSSSALTPQLPHARTWEVCVLFPGKGLEEDCQGSWGAGCVPGASSCPHLNSVSCHQQENPRVTNTSLLGDPGPLPGASCRLQALGGRVGAGGPLRAGQVGAGLAGGSLPPAGVPACPPWPQNRTRLGYSDSCNDSVMLSPQLAPKKGSGRPLASHRGRQKGPEARVRGSRWWRPSEQAGPRRSAPHTPPCCARGPVPACALLMAAPRVPDHGEPRRGCGWEAQAVGQTRS